MAREVITTASFRKSRQEVLASPSLSRAACTIHVSRFPRDAAAGQKEMDVSFTRPMRSELFRLGKRTQLSLDGTIKGIAYNHAAGVPAVAPLPTGGPVHLYEHPLPADYIPHGGPEPYVMPVMPAPDLPHIPRTPQPSEHLLDYPSQPMAADAIPGIDSYNAMLSVNDAIDEIQQESQAMHDAAFGIVPDAGPDPASHAIDMMFLSPRRAADEIDYGGPAMSIDRFHDTMADAGAAPVTSSGEAASGPQFDALDAMFHTPTHTPEVFDYQDAAMTPELFAAETGATPDADFLATPDELAADIMDPAVAYATPGPSPLEQAVQQEFDNMPDCAAPAPGRPMDPDPDPSQMVQDMYDLMMQQQMAPHMMPGNMPGMG